MIPMIGSWSIVMLHTAVHQNQLQMMLPYCISPAQLALCQQVARDGLQYWLWLAKLLCASHQDDAWILRNLS